jgi:diaminopimelate decarboxylase
MTSWKLNFEQTAEMMSVPGLGSPVYVYDQAIIERQGGLYNGAMHVGGKACKNFFAVKALPNPEILKIAHGSGMGFDASDVSEIDYALKAGADKEDIIFTSNNTTDEEFDAAVAAGAMLNFDDVSHVKRYLELRAQRGDGPLPIGDPSKSKFGMPDEDIIESFRMLKQSGVKRFGLHTMLLSNELDRKNHLAIAKHMFSLAHRVHDELGIDFEMINLGGGFGVAYRPEEVAFPVEAYGRELDELYDAMSMHEIGHPKIITENGRWVTGDAGFLLTKVINIKRTHGNTFVGVDTSIQNLLRAGIYGSAYHHATLLPHDGGEGRETEVASITGSLCEGNDFLAKGRKLLCAEIGDIVVLHTAGAHARAMANNYNAKKVAGEILLLPDGTFKPIRRAETQADHDATLIG